MPKPVPREGDRAMFEPLEQDLRISLDATDRLGHIRSHVDITPDHLAQTHRVEFEIGQSDLPAIVQECTAVVQATQFAAEATKKGRSNSSTRASPTPSSARRRHACRWVYPAALHNCK